MITYTYWLIAFGLALMIMLLVGAKFKQWRTATVVAVVLLIGAWAAYYFHFQQLFVKQWGGVMSVTVPDGQRHLNATWKDNHLWIENYDPKSNVCIFTEFSKGNMLQGKVIIKNCNPVALGEIRAY